MNFTEQIAEWRKRREECLRMWAVGNPQARELGFCADEAEALVRELKALRDDVQAMCFYWPRTKRHGYCKQANGMDHVCSFCELTERPTALIGDGAVKSQSETSFLRAQK